jgi:hypothetical protein
MAKDTTPDGRGDDRRDENTPAQDDAWAERLRREDEDARATAELPAAAPGQPTAPTAPTTPIVADDQRTRELPADGSAFRTATSAETIGTTTRRRPTKRLLVGIGIAAAGLALVGTSTAVAVSNAGSSTSASSTATPGRADAASQGDGSRPETGGRGSDDGATGATDAPTPPAAGDDSNGSAPVEGTGPDGKALPTPGTGPDGEALPTPGTGPDGGALPDAPEGGPAAGGPKLGPAAGGPKGGPGHGPRDEDAAAPDDAKGDDSTKPTPTPTPTPPADAPTPSDSPDAESGTGS